MAEQREDQVLDIVLPHWCSGNNRPSFVWGKGNRLLAYSARNFATDEIFKKENGILHEICWGASLFFSATRKLVNEACGIFSLLQQIDSEQANETNKKQLVNVSLRYRSVIKACIDNLQSSADSTGDVELKTTYELQSQLFYKMELIWNLCEILFIDVQPGGIILSQLLNWVKWHFPECEKQANEIIDSESRENHPRYWDTVHTYILQGRLEEARKLLKLHSNFASDTFLSIDELLRKMPNFVQIFSQHQSISEFDMRWRYWQEECQRRLQEGEYSMNKNIETICRILCGERDVFQELAPLCETWYHMLVSYLLYTNPSIKGCDLHFIAEECIDMYGGSTQMNALDSILFAVLEFDVIQVIKECSYYFDGWWFSAHLMDLLYHCKHLGIHELSLNTVLRESLILDYAACLMTHDSMWQVGAEYYKFCATYGRYHLEAYLERIPLDSDWKVQKVISIASSHNMNDLVNSICKIVGIQALQKNLMGTALSWALKSKDAALTSALADKFLIDYTQKGKFGSLDLLDNLGTCILISDKLTFLGKYREFHRLYEVKEFKAATALLVSLLSSRLAPVWFWMTLLLDALPLLESSEILFSSEQTYELLYCLEELGKSDYSEIKSKTNIFSAEKEGLIRLALARNLARTFVTEKSRNELY